MADYLQVPGAQVTQDEKQCIHDIATGYNRADVVMVNIGIMWGCTLWCLRAGAPLARLVGVDISPDGWPIKDKDELRAEFVRADSRTCEFDGLIDMLLIDGDHHYEVVHADIENWLPRIKKGGVVIFHDYAPTAHNLRQFPELEGVKRAADEWCKAHPEWTAQSGPDSLRILRWQ